MSCVCGTITKQYYIEGDGFKFNSDNLSDVTLGYILIDTCGLVERTVKSFVDILPFNVTSVIGENKAFCLLRYTGEEPLLLVLYTVLHVGNTLFPIDVLSGQFSAEELASVQSIVRVYKIPTFTLTSQNYRKCLTIQPKVTSIYSQHFSCVGED